MSRRDLRSLREDTRGVAAVEFALVLPILLLIYIGGYQFCEGVIAYRKVTITARTVVDLTTQYATMSANDIAIVLGASSQVMAPFNSANLSIVLTEYQTSSLGVSTVTWSKATGPNATPLTPGAVVTLPANICPAGTSVIYGWVQYAFTPAIHYGPATTLMMTDQIYMSPRGVTSVAYTGS